MKNKTCSICKKEYNGYGNNAEPINSGRCCDSCNRYVLWARLYPQPKYRMGWKASKPTFRQRVEAFLFKEI